jgi:hypothetical protein
MPNFLIRDIPQGTYDRLKEAAEHNQRSLNREIVSRLQASLLRKPRLAPEEFLRCMAEFRSHQKGEVAIEDIVDMVRTDRDDPDR